MQQRLTVQKAQTPVIRMPAKCPDCGYENRDEANYCLKCGAGVIAPLHYAPTTTVSVPEFAEAREPHKCSFHPFAIATYLCGRCGRPLCRSCMRPLPGMVLCPLCWVGPVHPHPWLPYPLPRPPYPLVMSAPRFMLPCSCRFRKDA